MCTIFYFEQIYTYLKTYIKGRKFRRKSFALSSNYPSRQMRIKLSFQTDENFFLDIFFLLVYKTFKDILSQNLKVFLYSINNVWNYCCSNITIITDTLRHPKVYCKLTIDKFIYINKISATIVCILHLIKCQIDNKNFVEKIIYAHLIHSIFVLSFDPYPFVISGQMTKNQKLCLHLCNVRTF